MEGAEEGDEVRPAGGVPGQLDRRLDDLRPRVAEVRPGAAALDRRERRQALAQLGVDRQVEVARREVDQVRRLLLDRRDDLRMRVAGGRDRDPGGEVEEEVAVDVLDGQPLAADRDDRVGARQARRGPGLVVGDVGPGPGAGDLGDDVGNRPRLREPRQDLGHGTPRAVWTHKVYADWISESSTPRRPSGHPGHLCHAAADGEIRPAPTGRRNAGRAAWPADHLPRRGKGRRASSRRSPSCRRPARFRDPKPDDELGTCRAARGSGAADRHPAIGGTATSPSARHLTLRQQSPTTRAGRALARTRRSQRSLKTERFRAVLTRIRCRTPPGEYWRKEPSPSAGRLRLPYALVRA